MNKAPVESALTDTIDPDDAITKPNLEDTARLFQGPLGIRSLSLTGLLLLAVFYTLYFARAFFLPIVLAVVFTFLLAPLVRVLKRILIPEFVGAALVIAGAFAFIGFVGYQLSAPLSDWVRRIPEIQKKLQADLQKLKKPVEQVSQASEQVRKLTSLTADDKKKPQAVELKDPGLLDGLFSRTWDFMFGFVVMVILLYFLLASGDLFLRKLIHVLPRLADKKKAVQIARQIEEHISRYLVTVAMINATLGIVAGLLLWGLGMPNPMLWGAMAGLFNFVPFLGAVSVIAILALVATATFSSLGHAFLIPAAYMGLALLEGNLINPWIVGRRLTLNPVVIFLGLTFWGWLWGISGALLAVPMLAMFKIFCDHIEPLAPIGEFLGH